MKIKKSFLFSFALRGVFSLFILAILFLYSSYLFLLPNFLNEENLETYLNNNFKNNSNLILDIENLKIKPDYKLNIVLKADKIKLKYSKDKDFITLEQPDFDINLLTLFQGYLDLNKIKIKKIDIFTDFTTQNKYNAFNYLNEKAFNFKYKNLQPKLRNINLLADSLSIKIFDNNIQKTFYINSSKVRLSSNSFVKNQNLVFAAKGSVFALNKKLSDFDLDLDIRLKDFKFENINKKLTSLSYNPFLYADEFNFYAKNDIDLKINVKQDKTDITGTTALRDFQFSYQGIKLPKNNLILNFKGDKISTDCDLKLINDKFIKVKGIISPYKNKFIELKMNSSQIDLSELNFVITPLSKIFNFKHDIRLKGSLLVDAYIKSDFKKITSNGLLELKNAKLNNKTLGLELDKINSEISFKNNRINILNTSFELGKEKFYLDGIIDNNSNLNLKINSTTIEASKLSSLIHSIPLISKVAPNITTYTIKEGSFNLKALIEGTLNEPKLSINSTLKNLKIYLKNQKAWLDVKTVVISSYKSPDITFLMTDTKISSDIAQIKVPSAKMKLHQKDITLDKTKIFIDKMPAGFDLKIKNYNSKNPDINFSLLTENLSDNNIIKIKENARLSLIGAIKQNKIILSDCKLFNETQNLALIKGTISNLQEPEFNLDLKIMLLKKISFVSKLLDNLSAEASGSVTIQGKPNNLEFCGDLNLANLYYPKLKLRVNNVILSLKNQTASFNAANVDLLAQKFDASGHLRYFDDKIIVSNIDIVSSYLNLNKFQNYKTDFDLSNLEIQRYSFACALAALDNVNFSNIFALGSFKNNTLNIKNLKSELFNGSISLSGNYNLKNQKIKTDLILRELNVHLLSDVIKEVVPLSFAASGKLSGLASVEFKNGEINTVLKTLSGYVKFKVENGELSQFAKLERFLQAGNILSQSIFKLSLNSIISTVSKQNTGDFKLIEGSLMIKNSLAEIKYLKTQGSNMSLYAKGQLNLITQVSNIKILGRVPLSTVSIMGKIGDFTIQKLMDKTFDESMDKAPQSVSPIQRMLSTTIPQEDLEKIPPLLYGENRPSRCFIVMIQGLIQNSNSIKNFKWHLER